MKKLKEHLYLWCHNAGVYNTIEQLNGFSDYSPVEAAAYLDIENIIMVVYGNKPEPPFTPIHEKFGHFKKVIWSLIGDSGSTRNDKSDDLKEVLQLAKDNSNVTGGIMDDFFGPSRPDFAIDEIAKTMKKNKLPLWIVLYDHDLNKIDNLAEKLEKCDVINFWTWDSANLKNLDKNIQKVKELAPNKPIALGCYMWNFNLTNELTVSDMKFQCNKALEYFKEGIIDDIVILGSPLVGMKLETVKWTKQWIKDNK